MVATLAPVPSVRLAPPRFRPCLEILEDRYLLSTFTVLNTKDSGSGSLPAIVQANSDPGPDTIVFDPSLAGKTIALTTANSDPLITMSGQNFAGGTVGVRHYQRDYH